MDRPERWAEKRREESPTASPANRDVSHSYPAAGGGGVKPGNPGSCVLPSVRGDEEELLHGVRRTETWLASGARKGLPLSSSSRLHQKSQDQPLSTLRTQPDRRDAHEVFEGLA